VPKNKEKRQAFEEAFGYKFSISFQHMMMSGFLSGKAYLDPKRAT
jgi:hypothetical protein